MAMNPPQEEKKKGNPRHALYTQRRSRRVASPRSRTTPSPEEPRPLYILPFPFCITPYHPGPVAVGAGLRVSKPLLGRAGACLLALLGFLACLLAENQTLASLA